jgi:signal transduction histidine kinase
MLVPLRSGHSLVLKLTLCVAVTLVVLEAVLLVTGNFYWRQILQAQIHGHLGAIAASRREMVETQIARLRQAAMMNTDRGEFRRFLAAVADRREEPDERLKSQQRLERIKDGISIFSASLADKTGRILLSTDSAEIDRQLSGDAVFRGGLVDSYLNRPRRADGRIEARIAAPVRVREETVGVLLMTVDASSLNASLPIGLGETGETVLLVRDGDKVHSLFPPRGQTDLLTIPASSAPELAKMVKTEQAFVKMHDYRGAAVLAAGGPTNYRGWALVAKIDEAEAYAPMRRAQRIGLMLGTVIAAAGLAAAYLVARGITAPVRRLAGAAARLARGDYSARVTVSSTDELGALSTSFNLMTDAIRARGAARDEAEAALRDADRRKDEFLAMLGHELRNPLSAIDSAVLVRKEGISSSAGDASEWEVIERQTGNLKRLVDDLLDVARISQGKIELRPRPVELGQIIGHAAEAVRPLIESGGHSFEVSVPEGLRVEVDPTRIEQVITNLLTNAAKYTPRGGRISIAGQLDGDQAVISVRDNGIGVAPEMLSRIFELFTQADRSLHRTGGGLGIGLNLCRRLVQLHGGEIVAQSDGPGRGSEFTVRLPIRAESEAIHPVTPTESSTTGRGRRILLVDDNTDTASLLERLLQRRGHLVRTAHDGIAGLQAAHDFQPEIVLLDIGLPGLDGYALARRLRAEGFVNIPLIAISGYAQESDRALAREAGFDHHFSKPVDFEGLMALL